MPSITISSESSSTYSFDTDNIKHTETDCNRIARGVESGVNVEHVHTIYLKDGTVIDLNTIIRDEYLNNRPDDNDVEIYDYMLQVYSADEVKNKEDPHVEFCISKQDSNLLKELCN